MIENNTSISSRKSTLKIGEIISSKKSLEEKSLVVTTYDKLCDKDDKEKIIGLICSPETGRFAL